MIKLIKPSEAAKLISSGEDVFILPTIETKFPKGDERKRLHLKNGKLHIGLLGQWQMTDTGSLHELTDLIQGGKYAKADGMIRVWMQK